MSITRALEQRQSFPVTTGEGETVQELFHWELAPKYQRGIPITCQALCDLYFQDSPISLAAGTIINATYQGIERLNEREHLVVCSAAYPGVSLGFFPQEITVLQFGAKTCFRCGTYHPFEAFIRDGRSTRGDTSPLLSEICAHCFQALTNKMKDHNGQRRNQVRELLPRLQAHLGLGKTDTIDRAIQRLAIHEGLLKEGEQL